MFANARPALVPLLAVALALAACGGAARDESGAIVAGGDLSVFELRAGDCFDDPPGILEGVVEVSELAAVPCDEPHDNEAYAVFDAPFSEDAPHPGTEAVDTLAGTRCFSEFAPYVGRSYETSRLDFDFLSPTPDSWDEGDREIICFLWDLQFAKLEGSMRGSGE